MTALTSLLAGVLKQAHRSGAAAGPRSDDAGSPLVLMLNRPDVQTRPTCTCWAATLPGGGIFSRLKTLVTDLYYRDDHDLVVNTPAMLGGTERTAPVRYWIDTGIRRHAFPLLHAARYVASSSARGIDRRRRPISHARSEAICGDGAGLPQTRERCRSPSCSCCRASWARNCPLDQQPVWMNMLALATGGLSLLGHGRHRGRPPPAWCGAATPSLCKYLARSHEVVPFPYDWRHSAGRRRRAAAAAHRKDAAAAPRAAQPADPPPRAFDGRPRRPRDARHARRAADVAAHVPSIPALASSCSARRTAARTPFLRC